MEFNPWNGKTVRYTLKKSEIEGFLADLRAVQEDMIERTVQIKEQQGFPEAQEVLGRFRLPKN
jgi:hypothetical protein